MSDNEAKIWETETNTALMSFINKYLTTFGSPCRWIELHLSSQEVLELSHRSTNTHALAHCMVSKLKKNLRNTLICNNFLLNGQIRIHKT